MYKKRTATSSNLLRLCQAEVLEETLYSVTSYFSQSYPLHSPNLVRNPSSIDSCQIDTPSSWERPSIGRDI
ncbi:hypothetical protein BU24DRAFT_422089 [Aaosphaeria arxii CBS 175.79]|uniref:Uncharacterized protein n=1 Tax=Aaosphaeria arxii CBS 175.79 TaxID=1450172 RepID=A0A6A5XRG8_9PLEO|nr:uncharacterized protein BU24DRAFT_422089 [Aaosphaeria arxii CBS 175.79]KAF2015772.1 hypothetical protein BU24DRAFT_422089 [Aaosphaeria arxii CBS 175.79]